MVDLNNTGNTCRWYLLSILIGQRLIPSTDRHIFCNRKWEIGWWKLWLYDYKETNAFNNINCLYMRKQQSIFNFNHIDPKLTEIEVSELKTIYKFYHKEMVAL